MSSNRTSTRATLLLSKLATSGWVTRTELARELRVSESTLAAYAIGERPIPLDRQLLLASLLIAKVPPLARMGHRLRGQVLAALAYQQQETMTHMTAPVSRFK